MSKKAFPFLALAAIALGLLVFRLLVLGDQEVQEAAKAPQAEAQPQPQLLPEAVIKGAGRLTMEDLAQFDRFPVFWVGPEYQGQPLTKILYMRSSGSPDGLIPPEEYVRIQYGTCDPGNGPPEESGCVRPLTIYSEPLCYNPPGRLAQGARQGPATEIRGGAQVQLVNSPPDQPKLDTGDFHFYFNESTVIISAAQGSEAALQAFGNLRGVNPPGLAVAASAGARLGAPISEEGCMGFDLPPIQTLATPVATVESTPTASPIPVTTTTPTAGGS